MQSTSERMGVRETEKKRCQFADERLESQKAI